MIIKSVIAQSGRIKNPILPDNSQFNKGDIGFLGSLIRWSIEIAFIAAVVIFLFTLLMGGISWLTSGGDEQKISSARGQITNAIIGLVITFSVLAIVKLVAYFFGIESMQNLIFTVPTLNG